MLFNSLVSGHNVICKCKCIRVSLTSHNCLGVVLKVAYKVCQTLITNKQGHSLERTVVFIYFAEHFVFKKLSVQQKIHKFKMKSLTFHLHMLSPYLNTGVVYYSGSAH